MKTLPILAALLLAAILPAAAQVQPGAPAPDFTLKDADGKDVALSSFKGKVVVLEWSNYQCPFVKMHYSSGNIPALQKKYTARGVVWLTIHSSAPGHEGYFPPAALKAEAAKFGSAPTEILSDADGTVGHAYGAKTTPHLFVIDGAGILRYNGAIDSIPSTDAKSLATATPYAANAIDAVLAGKAPSPAATQPYGCSVKYAR